MRKGGKLEPDTARAKAAEAKALKILDVARKMFTEDGYEFVTIRMIAAKARCSTGAIFNNWPDKRAIFLAAMNREPVSDAEGAHCRRLTYAYLAALYEIRRCCEHANDTGLRGEVRGVLDRLGGLL